MNKMGSLSSFAVTMSFLLLALAPSALSQTQVTSDFSINVTSANNITFTGFRGAVTPPPGKAIITPEFLAQFPALAGTGLSAALIKFGAKSINTLHSHPRGNELLTLLEGSIVAGVIDTSNRLFAQTLLPGDSFLFPIGLIHFQINNKEEPATALSAFSNPNTGRVTVTNAIFNSVPRLDVGFLEAALDLDAKTIERLFGISFPTVFAP